VRIPLMREIECAKDRLPSRFGFRKSGSIEQDAGMAGLLYKLKAGDEGNGGGAPEEEAVAVILLTAKQRNGPMGDVNLTFLKPSTRFEYAAKVSEEDMPH
jgi:replicative DNA helicase